MKAESLTHGRNHGFSLVEMMIVVLIIGVLAALAVPNFLATRISGNETTAISALRLICSAQAIHRVRYGSYATIDELRQMNLIDSTFADASERAGYVFNNLTTNQDTWAIAADPDMPGQSGDRYFFINESGVIRYSSSGAATSNDQPVE